MTTKERNKIVGANIANLRGTLSQTELAKAMSEMGHGWIQTTVSAVESGARALKFAEAVDIAYLLSVPLSALASEPDRLELENELRRDSNRLWGAYEGAIHAMKDLLQIRSEMGQSAVRRMDNPEVQTQEISDKVLHAFAVHYAECNPAKAVFNSFGGGFGSPDLYDPEAPTQTEAWKQSKAHTIASQTGISIDVQKIDPAVHTPDEMRKLLLLKAKQRLKNIQSDA